MPARTLDDLLAALTAATGPGPAARPEADTLDPRSTWNLSQTLQHCAQTIAYSVTGYPVLKPLAFRLTIGALVKRIFLWRGAMRHPLDAPIAGAPPLDANLPVTRALAGLTDAVRAFTAHSGEHAPHPAYGRCTHAEYAVLHALHLAEHLPGLDHG